MMAFQFFRPLRRSERPQETKPDDAVRKRAGFCMNDQPRQTQLRGGGALAVATRGERIRVYSHKSFGATPTADQSTSSANLE